MLIECMRRLCAGAGTKGLGEFECLSTRGCLVKRKNGSSEVVKLRCEKITDSV
jgi:hypothetical protein